MDRRNIFTIIEIIAAIAFLVLFSYFYIGIRSLLGLIVYVGIILIVYSTVVVISLVVGRRWAVQSASEEELKAEDGIFLQAVGFSQSALWIFLTLSPSNEMVDLMKWIIPVAAIICYATRAYAKLKNNNKWRFYSILILSVIIGISLSTIANFIMDAVLTGTLLIDGIDVTRHLVITPLGFLPSLIAVFSMSSIRKRYNI